MQNQILRRTIDATSKGQTLSNEGGTVFQVDPFTVLRRFLILGSTGTFYATAPDVTQMAVKEIDEAIRQDASRVLLMTVEVHDGNLALRTDPTMYVLARLTLPDVPLPTRRAAYEYVSRGCKTGTQFLHWLAYRKGMGKSNRSFRRAITEWFLSRTPGELALQAVKYDQRDGWSLRDALRLAKPNATKDLPGSADYAMIFDWITHPDNRVPWEGRKINDEKAQNLLGAYSLLREEVGTSSDYADLVRVARVPREAIPAPLLQHREVWDALWPDMPAQAFVRNLGKLTSLGSFTDAQDRAVAVSKIGKAAERLHPFAFLIARKIYEQGHGDKGKLSWTPQPDITRALEEAFGMAFGTLPRREDKRILVALDISGSMRSPAGGTVLSCHEASAALAMVLAFQFTNAEFVWFSHELAPFEAPATYDGVLSRMRELEYYMGGTYLDLPLALARESMRHGNGYDAVVTITDSETWHRKESPASIVKDIHTIHPEFRHAVVAMATNKISVADPNDPMQLDFVGLDASLPIALEGFLSGKF